MIDDSLFNCYVDYKTEYKTPQELPSWGVLSINLDQKKIEKEEEERIVAIKEQIKKGILKERPKIEMYHIKPTEKIKAHVTAPFVNKLKGVDLYVECPCGSGKLLINCHVREILSKK